jgi:hypothetical protein
VGGQKSKGLVRQERCHQMDPLGLPIQLEKIKEIKNEIETGRT